MYWGRPPLLVGIGVGWLASVTVKARYIEAACLSRRVSVPALSKRTTKASDCRDRADLHRIAWQVDEAVWKLGPTFGWSFPSAARKRTPLCET